MLKNNKILIYLADLTHTGPVLSSNVHPFGVGLIAAYLFKYFPDHIKIELFKYPHDLTSALEKQTPNIMGFSNYSWTLDLSYEYTRKIKKHFPETTVVFGGPNYGDAPEEIDQFWREYSLIDFCIVKEGEKAMVEFIKAYISNKHDGDELKQSETRIPNCHYLYNSNVIKGELLPRIPIDEIPSPYLLGLMDKFFDHQLIPMIHTTRGCPFKCTFCAEGAKYYQKVKHQTDLTEELEYIAQRIVGRSELYITDANFGMYKEDIQKAHQIAEIQQKYNFPDFIHVSSGKNKKDRILEVATIVNGAMRSVAAALQSTDENVLKNVNRSNISLEALTEVAQKASEANTDTYTEIILALPGDTVEAHTKTLRDVVEADLGTVRMYQLILLPQTELNTPDTRQKYNFKTMYRMMPRSFSKYSLKGESFGAVECEEICVANNTLSFDQYVYCRELDMTVEIIHNGRTFEELKGMCKLYGFSWFDFILRFFEKRRKYNNKLTNLYDTYKTGTMDGVWNTKEELHDFYNKNMDELLNNTEGTNEMSRAKSVAFFQLMGSLHDILYSEMTQMLEDNGLLNENLRMYLKELLEYSKLKKMDVLSDNDSIVNYHFDFNSITNHHFNVDPFNYYSQDSKQYKIFHDSESRTLIDDCVKEYGDSVDGLSRIIMFRIHYKNLFRQIKKSELIEVEPKSSTISLMS